MEINHADIEDLSLLVQLFDQYRVFYGQPSDLAAAESFLADRLRKNDSQILVARQKTELTGFTQLYPSFSSVSMRPI
jgi:hypothetical protein